MKATFYGLLLISSSCVLVHAEIAELGWLGLGVKAPETATGTGYLLYSVENVHTRFQTAPGQAQHFMAVKWDGTKWLQFEDDTAHEFVPRGTDVLVASLDYSADTSQWLIGDHGVVHGITKGIVSTDLQIQSNTWNGQSDPHEFGLTGTRLELARPAWWTDLGVLGGTVVDNHAVATIGQAKWMAYRAWQALDAVLPEVAAKIDTSLRWAPDAVLQNGWALPSEPFENSKPLSIGQLKAVVAPFYYQIGQTDVVGRSWGDRSLLAAGFPADPVDPDYVHIDYDGVGGVAYPWTNSAADDVNQGIATIGQLKSCFSLPLTDDTDEDGIPDLWEYAVIWFDFGATWAELDEIDQSDIAQIEAQHGMAPPGPPAKDTDGDGLPDQWEIDNGLDPNDPNDANLDPDGDSLDNLEEFQNGRDPNVADSEKVRRFRLQLHCAEHNETTEVFLNERLEQLVGDVENAVPTGRVKFNFGRNDPDNQVDYDVTLERLGEPLTFEVQLSLCNIYQPPLAGLELEELELDAALQLIIQAGQIISPAVTTNGLLKTGENRYLQAMELTAAFGYGPNQAPEGQPNITSREVVENYLTPLIITNGHQDDAWAVVGVDEMGAPKLWCVELVDDQDRLNAGLRAGGRYVVFDGHSNFGLGPLLPFAQVNRISDLTNYGVGYTDVPLDFRLRGDPADPNNWGNPHRFLQVLPNEIRQNPVNYAPPLLNEVRFPNNEGVGVGQPFPLQGQGFDAWHYTVGNPPSERLMIDAPDDDLPDELFYKTYFYNACSTGIDYIENFDQGDFVYTTDGCWIYAATRIFVQGVIEGMTTQEIVDQLNDDQAGAANPPDDIYEFHSF